MSEKSPLVPLSLIVEAGEAFGSGAHPTTALMLSWLARLAPDIGKGDRLLDFGCGSGVLTVAAAKATPASLVACDLQPEAIERCRRNAEANGVGDRIETLRANTPADPRLRSRGPYQLIVANILGRVLLPMLPGFRFLMAGEGRLLVSGILRWEREGFVEAAAHAGLVVHGESAEQDWIALCLVA